MDSEISRTNEDGHVVAVLDQVIVRYMHGRYGQRMATTIGDILADARDDVGGRLPYNNTYAAFRRLETFGIIEEIPQPHLRLVGGGQASGTDVDAETGAPPKAGIASDWVVRTVSRGRPPAYWRLTDKGAHFAALLDELGSMLSPRPAPASGDGRHAHAPTERPKPAVRDRAGGN